MKETRSAHPLQLRFSTMSGRARWCEEDDAAGAQPGDVVAGRYALLEPLGVGGMGEVWTAENLATHAEVAIKLLTTHTSTPDGIARFRREAHATAQLAHRGIVRVFDLVELPPSGSSAAGSVAMVMERLRGRTLADRLRRDGPLPVDATIGVVLPILSALHYAHGIGIIHRDLKPENIFLHLEPDGQVVPKLLDFGVSKILRNIAPPITVVGEVVGTPSHMSPEQVRGGEVDARSDVFCAGILLYTCLTGRSPFASEEAPASMLSVFEVQPERPRQASAPLWRVISRALEKNPDDRFASAAELAEALVRAAPGVTTDATLRSSLAPAVSEIRRPPHPARRRVRQRVASVAIAACVAGLSFGSSSTPPNAAGADGRFALVHEVVTRAPRPAPLQMAPGVDVLYSGEPPSPRPHPSKRDAAPRIDARAAAAAASMLESTHVGHRDPFVIRDPGF